MVTKRGALQRLTTYVNSDLAPGEVSGAASLTADIHGVSARAQIILISQYVEWVLEDAIADARFRALNATERKGLFAGEGPLARFSNKIKIAYALNLVGRQRRDDLDAIREMRNAAAHCKRAIDWKVKEVADACMLITICDHFADVTHKQKANPKERFRVCCQGFIMALGLYSHSQEPMHEKDLALLLA